MALEIRLFKCAETDPHRCQGRGDGGQGQCGYLAVEGGTLCAKHSGKTAETMAERKVVSNYRLEVWQRRIAEFTAN